jgi:hypothetical protein
MVRFLGVGLCSLLLPALLAQADPDGRRVARVGRVAEPEAPRIDGDLGDACWRDAPAIGELVMTEPWLGRQPTQRTVVKLLHDRHHLYLGLWCFDDDPTRIRASQRARDARLDPDDRVEIILDPFENRRTGYFFQIGAGGSIGDILISQNGGRFDKPWDAVWSGASRVTDEGWVAEVAIPFRSIPRREGAGRWGFNLARYVRDANEEYRWNGASQSTSFFRISECGTIDGIGDVDSGVGIEVVPYAAASWSRDRAVDRGWDIDPDAGGEAYWRITPSVTLATTLFTDFAETENDSRQINLNRFPLFFPEKRDFFLEGLSYFTFGANDAGNANFLPFFSRRIGLAGDGTKIPLQFGAKLTGEAGPFEFGLLDVQTDATAAVDEENLAVGRMKYAVGAQTTVGLIATNGDPTSAGRNHLLGADLWHRVPRWVGDLELTIVADAVASTGNVVDDEGESFGAMANARGSEWSFGLGSRQVADDFRPALGFVRRLGTRRTAGNVRWQPRTAEGSAIRRFSIAIDGARAEGLDGEPQETSIGLDTFGVQTHAGDELGVFVRREFERVEADFTLFRGSTTVFAGDYWNTRSGVLVTASEGRPWNGTASLSTGGFFDGRSDRLELDGEWRTSPLLHVGGGYRTAIVDLGPGRAFTTQVASGRVDLHFTPALSVRNLVQFDNESNVLGWQSRLRWIYAPGCDFFAVLGTAWQRDDASFTPTEQSLEFKVAHSLRF